MLRQSTGARRYNDRITLMRADSIVDDFGHVSVNPPVKVMDCFAYVRQMSANKTMMTFQQANVVGMEIEFRYTAIPFNVIEWRGKMIHFSQPENINNRNVNLRVVGYYQQDNPKI